MLFLTVLVAAIVALAAAPALAGGWWLENTPGQVDERNEGPYSSNITWTDDTNTINNLAPEDGYWGAQEDNSGIGSPHGGFTTTTNLCKTCHAVHLAGDNSYRLLKNGTTAEARSSGEGTEAGMGSSRATECMYCHDATAGASDARPYALGEVATVRGEHTIGSTVMPDSDVNGGSGDEGNYTDRDPATYNGEGAVLQCYQCHSVHGANTIGGPGYPAAWAAPWASKILRLDPAGDGDWLAFNALGTSDTTRTNAGNSPGGTAVANTADDGDRDVFEVGTYSAMGYDATAAVNLAKGAVKSSFCADCHNKNPNWDMSDQKNDETWYAYANSERPNPRSHVQGPKDDGLLEVYGIVSEVAEHEEDTLGNKIGEAAIGCRGCHSASDDANMPGEAGAAGASAFPHQSRGVKLTADEFELESYTAGGYVDDISGIIDDARRGIAEMDAICLECHSETMMGPAADAAAGSEFGVGWTF